MPHSHPFDAVFADLFAPVSREERSQIAASFLAASAYCQKCGHRDSYHQGGPCNYDVGGECGCTGFFAEVH